MEGAPRNYNNSEAEGQSDGTTSGQPPQPLETGSLRSELLSGRAQHLDISVRGHEFVEESGTVIADKLQPNDDREVPLGDPEDYGYSEPEYGL